MQGVYTSQCLLMMNKIAVNNFFHKKLILLSELRWVYSNNNNKNRLIIIIFETMMSLSVVDMQLKFFVFIVKNVNLIVKKKFFFRVLRLILWLLFVVGLFKFFCYTTMCQCIQILEVDINYRKVLQKIFQKQQ